MDIDKKTSLIELFNKQNIQYFAGPIQRNFDWIITDFEKYYKDLIEDTNLKIKKEHFMNVIVIKPLDGEILGSSNLIEYISLTNGQQRITTTYLTICATCAYAKNNNISKDEFDYEVIRDTFLINPTRTDDDRYKLLLRKKDRDTLKRIVDELPAQLNKKSGSSKIITAYNYLYSTLNKFNYKETFDKLFLMTTAPIIVEPEDDENTIFNDINSTGRKLSLYDQVKSHILGNYPLKKQEYLEEKYLEDIGNHKARNTIITSFLVFKNASIRSNSYNQFLEYAADKDMMEVILDISEFYKLYHIIDTASTGNDDLDWLLTGLNLTLPASQKTGLIKMYSYYKNGEIDLTTLLAVFKLLLNVSVRWKLKVKDVNAFRSLLEWNIKWIKPDNLYNLIYKQFSNYFISDSQFTMIIQVRNFYRGRKEDFEEENKIIPSNMNELTSYLLLSIENHHYSKGRINLKSLSREHICPQNLNDKWKPFFTEEEHHDYLHSLGNLTLTAYNSEYSDLSFKEKKHMENGFLEDKLYLSKSICEYTTWTVDSIRQRTEKLAEELCEIFSIPANNLTGDKMGVNQSILVGGK